MKKKIAILSISLTMLLSLSACNKGSKNIEELEKENASLKSQIEQLQSELEELSSESSSEVSESPDESDVASDESSESWSSQLQEIVLNNPFLVETEYGNYAFTIKGAELTDWWQRAYNGDDSKHVIVLSYEVENISFKTGELDYNGRDGVLVNDSAFRVFDQYGYELDSFNSTFSDRGFPNIVAPGEKSKEELPYVVDGTTDFIKVIFYRSTGDVGEITIDITQ